MTTATRETYIPIELAEKILIRFDGNKSKLYEFIDNCDKANKLISPTQKPILFALIETKLTDNARILIRNRNFADWPELKNHLLDAYSEKRTIGQWQLELNSCKQLFKENVRSYSNKIENCYIKLLNSLDENLDDTSRTACVNLLKNQAMNVFITGLNRELNLLVKAQKPESLEEAISIALAEEQEQLSKSEISKYQQLNNNIAKHCNYCDKSGHTSFNCYKNVKIKQEPRNVHYNSAQSFNRNNVRKFCNYCKKEGHMINECRKREYNNKMRSQNFNRNVTNQNQNSRQPTHTQYSQNQSNHLNSRAPLATAGTSRNTNSIMAESL